MRGKIMAGLAALMTIGCGATGGKVEERRLQEFRKGETTYQEVVQALGKPTYNELREDGSRQMVYTYTQQQIRATSFVPILGSFVRGADSEQTNVVLDFDPQQRLVTYRSTSGQLGQGTGFVSGARQ